jgi:hypothetical protein
MPVNIDVPGLGPVSIPDDVPVNLVDDYVNQIAKSKNINLPAPEIPKKPYTFGAGLRDVAVGTAGIIPSFVETFAEFTPTDTFGRLTGADKGIASLLKGVAPEYSEDIGKLGISRGNAKFMRDLQKDLYSEQSKAAQKNLAKKLEESTSLLDEAGIAARETLTTPELLASYGPEALSSIVGGRLLGTGLAKVGKAVAPKLAEAAGERAAKILGEKGMKFLGGPETIKTVVGGATMQGASVANQNFNSVMEMDGTKLAETPEYQAAIKEGASPEDARRIVAEGAASGSLLPATALSLVAQYAVPGGHSLEQLVAGAAGKTLGKSASQFGKQTAKSFFGEGFSEAGEEGGGQYLGNIFMPGQQDPMQGVGAAAGMAGAMGALMGGGAGGINALQAQRAQKVMEERAQAEKEKEQAIPDVAEIAHPLGSNLPGETVSAEAKNFLSKAEKDKPFGLDYINKQTGDDVAHEGDATAVANELIRRGEIVNTGTEEAPQFSFIKEEDRIAPHLDGTTPYFYASPATRQTGETTAEGYEVTNPGINVTRKAATPEEAENIKTQMDARVERMTGEIDKKIESQNEIISAVSENLNIAIASDMSDEKLSEEHDNAAAKIAEAQQQIEQLNQEREKIATPTEVKPINEKKGEESGYEVRQYRPGKTAKTVVPFATREEAEKFIAENAPLEQQQAIYQDEAPHREGLRKAQKDLFAPEETPTEEGAETTFEPQATPEMQQNVQAVTSRLRGVLDQMGLQNIGLNISNKLTSMVNGQMTPVDGYYLNRVIHASLDNTRGVLATFGHETVHALRELGMFSDKEWDILTRKAKSEWIKKYRTEERYGHLSEEEQIEEAISDAFGDWMGGDYKPTGAIQGLLNRMKMFLESMGSTLRGQGFDSTEKVFQRALSGELKGARAEQKAEGVKHALSLEDYNNLSPEAQQVMAEDFLYSPLNRLVANAPKKLDNQSAGVWRQWFNANASQAGGKEGEYFWTGLDEWLVNQGKDKVSQTQIAEYLKAFDNPRDVVYESAGRPEIGVIDVTDQMPEQVDPNGKPVEGAYEFVVNIGGQDFSFLAYKFDRDDYPFDLYDVNNEFMDSFEDIEDIKQELAYEANESLGAQGNTKFSQWTLDGGDNYREIPVVLSGPAAKKVDFNFYGTHWPDANVIYHIRTNDRQDVIGNNVLFVEEVQSDWAQKGREEGFVSPEQAKAIKAGKLPEGWRTVKEYLTGPEGTGGAEVWYVLNEQNVQSSRYTSTEEEAISDFLERLQKGKGRGVPAGPYVQDTSKWVELAAKRIIAMAVNGGYDKVAFINPKQAHKRFPTKKDGDSTKEGFENFYGKILPNKLNSLLKKYGSEVEVVYLPVVGDFSKWVAGGEISQQLGFSVTPELVKSVRQNGFPRHALPMTVLAQGKRKPSLNANGSQIYPTKDGIRNFWRWFGDGQLVDKEGRPRLFYHGSTRNIEAFKTGTADAIFFSPSPIPTDTFINYKAEELGEDRNKGVVYPVYLNPKNVFDYENEEQVNRLVDEVMKGANIKIFQNIRKVILHPYYSVKVPSEGGGTEEEFYVAPESIIEPKKYSKEGLRQRLMSGAWPVFETGEVIDAIKRLDFDGFFITEATKGQFYKNVAVFSPKQIKAAFGNNGEFGLGSDKIQFALPQNVLGQPATLPTWTEPTDSKTDDAIFQIQDKMVDVKRVVQEITKAAGNILDKWNPYLQEELYHGRTAQQTERFLRTELRPLLLDLSKHNISIPEFEEFLHNRHAEERNKQIASINPAMPDAGSGIATQTARNYLNAIPPARRRLLDSIAKRVDDINRGTRQVLVDSGLELPQTIASWEQTYPHYVPLFREDADYVTTSGYGVGQGFNIRGDFSKRAMGSNRGVVQIFANIVMQRERATIRAEKNRVAQSVYGLAVQNPNKDFWLPIDPEAIKDVSKVQNELLNLGISPNDIQNIFQQPTRKVIDHRTGLVTNKIDPYVLNSPNILATRINGRNHYLLFNNNDPRAKRMVSALKNLDADQLGRVMSIMGGISRWFARVNTQYNPIFGIVNFLRDIEGATLNLSTTPIADKVKDVMSVENLNGALGAIWKVSRAERDKGAMPASKWAKLWQELQEEGGQTGYRSMYSSAEERADAIKTEIKNIDGTGVMPKLRALGDFLSDYNTSMENAVRLTAYKAALDKGLSKQQAASVAKNITVNFNRKGNIATQMGALYAFFNASVQGNARILETLRGPMAKKIIYGGLLLGIVQALALAAAGFDEDEPPEFLKERNIVIPVGGKKYISIPMPLGYNVIPNVSRNIMEWGLSGFRDTGKHITGILGSVIDTFNPIGGGGWSLQTVAPTALDPFAALAENKDSFGRPIYKSELNATDPTPGYLRTKDTATAWSKWMAEFLNKASGGTKYKPGAINWTPDQIDYVIGQIGGGVAREIGKGAQAVSSISTGEELAPYKIPLVGRFYGNAESNAAQMQRYYDNITRLNEHENEIKGRRKNHEPVFEYIKENPEAKLVPISNSIENNIKELRQQKKRLTERGANPEQIKRINDRIIAQMKRLNEQVKKLRD